MKFVATRPYPDPELAARKLIEIASAIEPVQNGRIFVELVNAPFLKADGSGGSDGHLDPKAQSRRTKSCGLVDVLCPKTNSYFTRPTLGNKSMICLTPGLPSPRRPGVGVCTGLLEFQDDPEISFSS